MKQKKIDLTAFVRLGLAKIPFGNNDKNKFAGGEKHKKQHKTKKDEKTDRK